MGKNSKGSAKGDKSMGSSKNAMSQRGNGTMNAKEVTDGFASADASKLKRGEFKDNRYR
jgi:hypothetical protein